MCVCVYVLFYVHVCGGGTVGFVCVHVCVCQCDCECIHCVCVCVCVCVCACVSVDPCFRSMMCLSLCVID